MPSKLVQSILITGPSGSGKSSFARKALDAEGSGIVAAMPGSDELDSYYGLEAPAYALAGFDDSSYLPSTTDETFKTNPPHGLRDLVRWLYGRLTEVMEDVKSGKPSRYNVVVVDTLSAAGQLATNATLVKFNRTEAPPAMSPDGAAFYTYLRSRQEELMRVVRAFKGYGVHIIALSHVGESEVGEQNIAKALPGKQKMFTPLVPGAFKLALPSFFSTVMYSGVQKDDKGKVVHYLQWMPDEKRPTKNRFGSLGTGDKLPNDWLFVKDRIEKAALAKLNGDKNANS